MVQLAVVAGVEAVAALEVRGQPRQRAVGIELEAGEGEVVVTEAGAENLSSGIPRTADAVEAWVQARR